MASSRPEEARIDLRTVESTLFVLSQAVGTLRNSIQRLENFLVYKFGPEFIEFARHPNSSSPSFLRHRRQPQMRSSEFHNQTPLQGFPYHPPPSYPVARQGQLPPPHHHHHQQQQQQGTWQHHPHSPQLVQTPHPTSSSLGGQQQAWAVPSSSPRERDHSCTCCNKPPLSTMTSGNMNRFSPLPLVNLVAPMNSYYVPPTSPVSPAIPIQQHFIQIQQGVVTTQAPSVGGHIVTAISPSIRTPITTAIPTLGYRSGTENAQTIGLFPSAGSTSVSSSTTASKPKHIELITRTRGLQVFSSALGKSFIAEYQNRRYRHRHRIDEKQPYRLFSCYKKSCRGSLYLSQDYKEIKCNVGDHICKPLRDTSQPQVAEGDDDYISSNLLEMSMTPNTHENDCIFPPVVLFHPFNAEMQETEIVTLEEDEGANENDDASSPYSPRLVIDESAMQMKDDDNEYSQVEQNGTMTTPTHNGSVSPEGVDDINNIQEMKTDTPTYGLE